MKTIWKYTLKPAKSLYEIPSGGIIRHVDEQRGDICIWVEVETEAEKENREILIVGTGHEINISVGELSYIGSVKIADGIFVFHIYEVL